MYWSSAFFLWINAPVVGNQWKILGFHYKILAKVVIGIIFFKGLLCLGILFVYLSFKIMCAGVLRKFLSSKNNWGDHKLSDSTFLVILSHDILKGICGVEHDGEKLPCFAIPFSTWKLWKCKQKQFSFPSIVPVRYFVTMMRNLILSGIWYHPSWMPAVANCLCHLELLQQDRGKNLEELGGMGRERLEFLSRVWKIIMMGTQKTRTRINQQSLMKFLVRKILF